MIIGISGKIGSGKDTVGKIIQYLTSFNSHIPYDKYVNSEYDNENFCDWKIKKFAYAVKQVCSILTGIPVEDFEKEEIKNSYLGEEWIRYGYANGFYRDMDGNPIMNNKQCSKEVYQEQRKINWQTAYKHEYTVRELLQLVGTDAIRNIIHENAWVNALFANYISEDRGRISGKEYPESNWIITDVRFPNEFDAIKERGGIIIRVNRKDKLYIGQGFKFTNSDILNRIIDISGDTITYAAFDSVGVGIFNINERQIQPIYNIGYKPHPSETALDNHSFDYTIDNNGTIEELIEKVKEILIKEKII